MAVNIRVDITDPDVDMEISKLKMALTLQGQVGGTRIGRDPKILTKELADFKKVIDGIGTADPTLLATFAEMDLPTVNRELRMILGQIPGMREWMSVWFRVTRAQRGVRQLMGGIPGPLMLVIVASTLQAVTSINKAIKQWERQVRQDRGDYEDMFREGLDLTHEEWINIGQAQAGFATWGQQFTAMREEFGEWEATMMAIGNWWEWTREKFPGAMPGYGNAPRYDWDPWSTGSGSGRDMGGPGGIRP